MAKEKQKSNAKTIILTIIITLAIIFIGIPLLISFIIGIVVAALTAGSDTTSTHSGNVAKITIAGTILTESDSSLLSSSASTSSSWVVNQLKDIKEDKDIKGVIFEINSPGGSGVASDEIAQAIKTLDKPTVAYIREVGASGSYWVASSTDYIYTNRFSTVGSIGVISSYLVFEGLLDDYNVTYERFVAGDNKDFGTPFREPTNNERKRYQAHLDELHEIFIEEVAHNRNLSIEHVTELADGFVFTGSEAINNGLVDEIGNYDSAISYMTTQINETIKVVPYHRISTFADLFAGFFAQGFKEVGRGFGDVFFEKKPNFMLE